MLDVGAQAVTMREGIEAVEEAARSKGDWNWDESHDGDLR